MAKLLKFRGGRLCEDCGEQIPPKRIQAKPNAKKCRDCQTDGELRAARIARNMSPNDIAIIRG